MGRRAQGIRRRGSGGGGCGGCGETQLISQQQLQPQRAEKEEAVNGEKEEKAVKEEEEEEAAKEPAELTVQQAQEVPEAEMKQVQEVREQASGEANESHAPAPAPPAPLRRALRAEDELICESARLECEVAAAWQRLRNRDEQHLAEIGFWRQRALGLELRLAEGRALATEAQAEEALARQSGGENGGGGGRQGAAADVAAYASAEELMRQSCSWREAAEQRLEATRAALRGAEARLTRSTELSAVLQSQACQQAVSLLTRRTTSPAETFVNSLSRFDAQTLRWVRSQIELQKRERELGTEGLRRPAIEETGNGPLDGVKAWLAKGGQGRHDGVRVPSAARRKGKY